MPFHLAQLSDTHVVADGTEEVLYVDNNARAAMAVDAICGEAPSVAAVLATGDLTQWGTDAEYDKLAEVLAPLNVPMPADTRKPRHSSRPSALLFRSPLARCAAGRRSLELGR